MAVESLWVTDVIFADSSYESSDDRRSPDSNRNENRML